MRLLLFIITFLSAPPIKAGAMGCAASRSVETQSKQRTTPQASPSTESVTDSLNDSYITAFIATLCKSDRKQQSSSMREDPWSQGKNTPRSPISSKNPQDYERY